MAETESIPVPQLAPADVNVFLATPDSSKRIAVVRSLKEFGLGDDVRVAVSWRSATGFVHSQEPGELEANVFLFDGQLDFNETAQGERQGNRLMQGLFNAYKGLLSDMTYKGREQTIKDGLTPFEASFIFNSQVKEALAARRLGAEALLVGISESIEGTLSYPAQVPLTPYNNVGQVVFDKVIAPEAQQRAS